MKINRLINHSILTESFTKRMSQDLEDSKKNLMCPASYLLNVVKVSGEENLTIHRMYRELLFSYASLLKIGSMFDKKLKDEDLKGAIQIITDDIQNETELSYKEYSELLATLDKYNLFYLDNEPLKTQSIEKIYHALHNIFMEMKK